MSFADLPISDSHIHIFWDIPLAEREKLLREVMEELGYDTVTVLTIPYSAYPNAVTLPRT